MNKKSWSKEERKTLVESVDLFRFTKTFNGHATPSVDWGRVAGFINREHGGDRSSIGCKNMFMKHNGSIKND